MAHACDPSTWEVHTGDRKFNATLKPGHTANAEFLEFFLPTPLFLEVGGKVSLGNPDGPGT